MDTQPEKVNIRGILFDSVTMQEAVLRCETFLLQNREAKVIHTPNAEMVQMGVEDAEIRSLINSADLIVPDGAGVVLAAKILHRPLRGGKVAGIELCEQLLALSAKRGYGVYFLGGKPGVAAEAANRMAQKYEGLRIVGTHDGYFQNDAAIIEEINDSGASLLLVCLGVPKQERWMHAHRDALQVSLMGGFGGSFDVFAGKVRRAPKFFLRCNLEWFYRLLCEPKRIGRMMKLPKFILGTLFAPKTDA